MNVNENSVSTVAGPSGDCPMDLFTDTAMEEQDNSMEVVEIVTHDYSPMDLSSNCTTEFTILPTIFYSSLQNSESLSWVESLKRKKFTANSKDNQEISEFHLSCALNEPEFARVFIDNGANVNSQVPLTSQFHPGFTPLHFAVKSCSIKVMELLLQSGADPNLLDKTGTSPLHLACEKIEESFSQNCMFTKIVINLLLEYKANPIIADSKGCTPLHKTFYYKIYGYSDLFDQLIAKTKWDFKNNHTDEYGLSLFHIVCSEGFETACIGFLNAGVNVNSRVFLGPYSGFTALHFAVMHDREDICDNLLKRKANVNAKDDVSGGTPLHLACQRLQKKERNSIIEILLDYDALTNVPDKSGRTPLHECFYALNSEGSEALSTLISKTVWDFDNLTDEHGLSLFHLVCSKKDISIVKGFLDFAKVDVNSCPSSGTFSGFTALHFAAMYNQAEIVKCLLMRNARVNVVAGKARVTPLHLACKFSYRKFIQDISEDQIKIINLLISHGADVDAQDSLGVTPLHYACMIDNNQDEDDWDHLAIDLYEDINNRLQDIIRIFISNNVDVDARTNEQSTILHLICKHNALQISENLITLLILEGIDLNARDIAGLTPLHVAVKVGNKRMVKILLHHNADPDIKCRQAAIPLHTVVQQIIATHREGKVAIKKNSHKNNLHIFHSLVENGSDVNIRKRNGESLLHDAVKEGIFVLTKNLMKFGADINVEDSFGNSSLHYLFQQKNDPKIAHLYRLFVLHLSWRIMRRIPLNDKSRFEYVRFAQESGRLVHPDKIHKKCYTELKKMKLDKIEKCGSLYDFLRKCPYELIYLVKNKNLINIVKNVEMQSKYPLYGHLLKVQYKRGIIRREQSESAEVALCNITNFELPNLCCQEIFQYLTNDELHNLIEAAPKKKDK